MGEKLKTVFQYIDAFSGKTGGVVSMLALVLMLIVVIRVVARYVFDVPFIWGFPVSRQVFGVFILFAGVYAVLKGAHLRVEVLYNRLSPRVKFCTRLIDLAAFLIFIAMLIWQAGWMAGNSIINTELSQGTPKVPLYVIKAFIPVVAFLFLLEGISAFFRKDTNS
jgi:TRAP-type mannitol/chloroaromatic compound transport system permease small subunit